MPNKRKTFNRRALSSTSTRTHLEGRRSVELMNLSFKPVRASCAQGFQGPYGGSQLVLTLYRIYIFCFRTCNRLLPELMKNRDAGIFPVYYSLKRRNIGFPASTYHTKQIRKRNVASYWLQLTNLLLHNNRSALRSLILTFSANKVLITA